MTTRRAHKQPWAGGEDAATRPAPGTDRIGLPMLAISNGDLRRLVRDAVRDVVAELQADSRPHVPQQANLTIEEVASELRCAPSTVRRYISEGRLVSVRVGHGGQGRVLVQRHDLDAFVAAGRP